MKREKQQDLFVLWGKVAKSDRHITDSDISSSEKFTTYSAVETPPSPIVAYSSAEITAIPSLVVERKSCPLPLTMKQRQT